MTETNESTPSTESTERFNSFSDFYPYYLGEHSDLRCRRLHYIGSWLVIGVLLLAIVSANPWWLIGVPLIGYGFAWVGHFHFEKNKPATFKYPFYSLMGDWVMWWQILRGQVKI